MYFSICLNKIIVLYCLMENSSCIRLKADNEQIANGKETVKELEDSFYTLSNALSLAGNNVRLKILFLLSKKKNFVYAI